MVMARRAGCATRRG